MSKFTRRAGKRDAIEPFVIGEARRAGWLVMQLDSFDLLCFRRGVFLVVEVKTGDKPLTHHQENLVNEGWPLVIIRSVEQAREVFA